MSQYDALDALILAAIQAKTDPLYSHPASTEALRLANATGREAFRILDARLQALRKAGKIKHLTKTEGKGTAGWVLVANQLQSDIYRAVLAEEASLMGLTEEQAMIQAIRLYQLVNQKGRNGLTLAFLNAEGVIDQEASKALAFPAP